MAKGAYIGVATEFPVYEETKVSSSATVTDSNIEELFEVTNGQYGFTWDGEGFASYSGITFNPATSTSTWKAKYDMPSVSFDHLLGANVNNKLTIKVAGTIVVDKVYGNADATWTGSLKAGETIELSSYNQGASSHIRNFSVTYETVTREVVGTETKGIARKTKKGYIGANGVARKIKKAYIGIGGVARPCWAGGEAASYGKLSTGLSKSRQYFDATTVGDYAVFAGGYDNTFAGCKAADAFNSSLSRIALDPMAYEMDHNAGATVGDYACFVGTMGNGPDQLYASYAYRKDLPMTKLTNLPFHFHDGDAATIGDYALFGGGSQSEDSAPMITYNSSLTMGSATMSAPRTCLAAATIGDHALFAGGISGSYGETKHAEVDAFDASLTMTTIGNLSVGRYRLSGCSNSEYALFGGGQGGSNNAFQTAVDAYNASLTRTIAPGLSVARYYFASTAVGDFAFFGGGRDNNNHYNTVDVYDGSLTRTTTTGLTNQVEGNAAATIGNYALFAGGSTDGYTAVKNTVDVYTVV